MDVILELTDSYFFTPFVYPESVTEDNMLRQFVSLSVVVTVIAVILYLITASLSYVFAFDRNLLSHPLILEVSEYYL